MSDTVKMKVSVRPLVLALDIGSTGSRGGVFDASGTPVRGRQHGAPLRFETDDSGKSIINADGLVEEISRVIDRCLDGLDEPIAAVAFTTFGPSLLGTDNIGTAITPLFTPADTRCSAEVERLRADLDEAEHCRLTGTRFHSRYLPARLMWLRNTQPEIYAEVRHWMSLSEYVHQQLLGVTAAGASIAACSGLANRRTGRWHEPILDYLGLDEAILAEVRDVEQTLTPVTNVAASRWPALAEAVWLPGVTDHVATGLALGADFEDLVASLSATGALYTMINSVPLELPSAAWCHRLDADRALLGGSIDNVGSAVSWLHHALALPKAKKLTQRLLAEPTSSTPMVLPFFAGENAGARFRGVLSEHGPAEIYRGALEGIALSYAQLQRQLLAVTAPPRRILAHGEAAEREPALLQLVADALGVPVYPNPVRHETLYGSALVALELAAPTVERARPMANPALEPDAGRAEYYADRLAAFERLSD